jgi:hypothetical protein
VAPDVDVDSLLFLLETFHLGLFLQRGAGMPPPEPDAWEAFLGQLVAALADSGRPRRRRTS